MDCCHMDDSDSHSLSKLHRKLIHASSTRQTFPRFYFLFVVKTSNLEYLRKTPSDKLYT